MVSVDEFIMFLIFGGMSLVLPFSMTWACVCHLNVFFQCEVDPSIDIFMMAVLKLRN